MKLLGKLSLLVCVLTVITGCEFLQILAQSPGSVSGQWMSTKGEFFSISQSGLDLTITSDRGVRTHTGALALAGVINRTNENPGGGVAYLSGQVSADATRIEWKNGEVWFRAPTDLVGVNKNTYLEGEDYKDFDVTLGGPSACRDACTADPSCRAYSFAYPWAWAGEVSRCWLKDTAGQSYSRNGYFSGVFEDRIAGDKPEKVLRHFVSLDQIDCRDTDDWGEDEVYIMANVDGAGFRRYGPKEKPMNEDSDMRYWYPGLRWEFRYSVVIQIWEENGKNDELIGQKTFLSTTRPGSDHFELFSQEGVYQAFFSKGPVTASTASGQYTLVIERVATIKPASGIEKGLTREIMAATEYSGIANTTLGYFDGGLVTEWIGYGLDISNMTATVISLVDDALGSPDQLIVYLDGKQIWPKDGRAYVDSDKGRVNWVYHAAPAFKAGVLELFDHDKESNADSLGQLYFNTTKPMLNDPRVQLLSGDADEGSIYLVTSRLYQSDQKEFCRRFANRSVVLFGEKGFLHARSGPGLAHVETFSGPDYPSSNWTVNCDPGGTVAFKANTNAGDANLGASLGVQWWTPLRQVGTDRWAFRREMGRTSKEAEGATFLHAVKKDISLNKKLRKWSRFVVFEARKGPGAVQLDRAFDIKQAARNACVVADNPGSASAKIQVANPCPAGAPRWRFESGDGRHAFAYKIRLEGAGATPLYLLNDPEQENLQLSTCSGWPDGCYWYVRPGFNLPIESEVFIRSALPDYLGLYTDLVDPRAREVDNAFGWPRTSAGEGKSPGGWPLLGVAVLRAASEYCTREHNDPECQWRLVP